MSFWDNPIIDKNAERSEDSVISTQAFFSLKNGFISRLIDGSKDYGVDISCELIDNSGATGNSFPIQIKSTRKAIYIFKNQGYYYSLSFSTSRLGYLCRHTPSYGIIVFYNEDDETLYYDYVREIYNRIRLERKDETWKDKETVTIHIPEQNKVKNDIGNIHRTFSNIFSNANDLFEEHGGDYGIPPISSKRTLKNGIADVPRISKAINLIETIGPYLFNKREYSKILELLEILPKKAFYRHKVSYIAALIYTELGEFLEADYFLKLSYSQKDKYSNEEFVALEMQRFKVDFSYGSYDKVEFISNLKLLRRKCVNTDNQLNIDININMLEINQRIGEIKFDKDILLNIEEIFESIEKITKDEEQKNFQRIFQSENLLSVLSRLLSDFLNDNRLLLDENRLELIRNRNAELEDIKRSFEKAVCIINDSLAYADSTNNELMKAHASHKLAFAFFSMNLPMFMNSEPPSNTSEATTILKSSLNYAITAYNLFLGIKIHQYAFRAITLAYEICRLSEEWLGESLDEVCPISEISMQIEKYHSFEFFGQFSSVIDRIAEHSNQKNDIRQFNDDELSYLADRILKLRKLPPGRKDNLLNELRSFQYFENKCVDKTLQLLSNQVYNDNLAYSVPTRYAIANKDSGIVYAKGLDVKIMMTTLGIL